MKDDNGNLIYLGKKPLAAILLNIALVPMRGLTTASNFTFVFLALTILVGEFGGRTAALTTAVTSALSLDFFLTQPYLRLAIQNKHDIITFFGLAACKLLTTSLASERGVRPREPRPGGSSSSCIPR
jgi:K+-sensing histidine kinase KdpD